MFIETNSNSASIFAGSVRTSPLRRRGLGLEREGRRGEAEGEGGESPRGQEGRAHRNGISRLTYQVQLRL